MTTLTYPSIVPSSADWSLESNTKSFTSPLNNSVQTLEMEGARWKASLTYDDLNQDEARELSAFLVRLRGQAGRFYLYDHSLPNPRGTATGTPLVNGASQTGSSLITDGWTPSVTGIMKAGDYIGVGDWLHMVVVDADSDSGGNSTLTIEPPLRASPSDNAAITVTKPTAVMRLLDDNQTIWKTRPPILTSFTITAIESFTS